MDAFDADCVIYATAAGHPLGTRVAALLAAEGTDRRDAIGSTVLIPELLSKPIREHQDAEVHALTWILSRLDLRPVDRQLAALAAHLGARYRLRAPDAIHLATAVAAGADRFITDNRRDFDRTRVSEVDITYPEMLPGA